MSHIVFLIVVVLTIFPSNNFLLAGGAHPTNLGLALEGVYPYEEQLIELPFLKKFDSLVFSGTLKAQGNNGYPEFQSKHDFVSKVNQMIRQNAKSVLCQFIAEFSIEELQVDEFDKEALELEFDKREFRYCLTPMYASLKLISVFGELHSYSGMPHGSSRYYGFNYWIDEGQIKELALEDLFNSGSEFVSFISEYCLAVLSENSVGYFSPNTDILPAIDLDDLRVFTLSQKALIVTFQPYTVGGWADGPYSVSIPYEEIAHLVGSNSPLNLLL